MIISQRGKTQDSDTYTQAYDDAFCFCVAVVRAEKMPKLDSSITVQRFDK